MKYVVDSRPVLAMVIAAAAFIIVPFPSIAQTPIHVNNLPTLILVRHAEKAAQPAEDPPLTAPGEKRAQDLVAALRDAGVTSIITTQLRRTRETAQPLAAALGITAEIVTVGQRALVANPAVGAKFPPEVLSERAEYVKQLERVLRGRSGVVLVVGHDWSAPGLIALLGGPQLPNICSSIYDKLFILTSAGGKIGLVQARYGAPTPDADCK